MRHRGNGIVVAPPRLDNILRSVARSSTPDPIPMYSDIAQRHCDSILMKMQEEAIQKVKQRFSPQRQRSSSAAPAVRKVTQKKQPPTPDQGRTPAVTFASDAKLSEKKKPARKQATQDTSHDIPTTGGDVALAQAPKDDVPNPTLPSELLPILLPGVPPSLLQEAAKRHKRAQKRRRDFLKLLKPNRKNPIHEEELFPASLKDLSSEEEDANDVEQRSMANAGGVESPRLPPTAEDGSNLPDLSTTVLVASQPTLFYSEARSNRGASRVGESHLSPTRNASAGLKLQGAVKVQKLPQTSEYLHLIRMQRKQQKQWRPDRDWSGMIENGSNALPGTSDAMSAIADDASGSYSLRDGKDDDALSCTNSNPSCSAAAESSMLPAVFKLNFSLLSKNKVTSPQPSPTVTKPCIPMLNMKLAFASKSSDSPPRSPSPAGLDNNEIKPSSTQESNSSRYEEPVEPRGSIPHDPSIPRNESVEKASTVGSSVNSVGPGVRRGAPDNELSISNNGAPPPPRSRWDSSSSSEEDNIHDLREQFANFLQQHTHHEVEDDGELLETVVKPFVLPQTFVRYTTSNFAVTASPGRRAVAVGKKGRKRMNSLVDEEDKSTPLGSDFVKIVWGSCPSNVEPSTVARMAPCRLVVELMFRPGYHHFDARHLYDLMQPHVAYILDLEAGNRGGKFLAIYSVSELQALKAIAALMSKVRSGESPYLQDVFSAQHPFHVGAPLVESPRDCDLPECREKLAHDGIDESESMPDPMSWFRAHAVAINEEVVNHHAPGAMEQYLGMLEKKRRQAERLRRQKKKLRGEQAAVAALTAQEAEPDGDEGSGEINIFVAEGDEVDGLDELKRLQARLQESENPQGVPDAENAEQNDDGGDGRALVHSNALVEKKVVSIFARVELDERSVEKALESNELSIMQLAAKSKFTPEELRKMKLRKEMEKRKKRKDGNEEARKERIAQQSIKTLKEFRDEKIAEESGVDPSGNKKLKKSLHQKRKKKADQSDRKSTSEGEVSPAPPVAAESLSDVVKPPDASDAGVAVEGEEESLPELMSEDTVVLNDDEATQEMEDAKALEYFSEFLYQYALSEKVAVIAPLLRFDDPSISPTPNAEQDAEELIFLLQQLDFDIVIMEPPRSARMRPPGPDATDDEREEYQQMLDFDSKRWFLSPTTENIYEVMEALLKQNAGGRYCCVSLFLLTRGFVGGLEPKHIGGLASAKPTNQFIAMTLETNIAHLTPETTFSPREFLHRMKKATGKFPMVFCDTYPIVDSPYSDVFGNYVMQHHAFTVSNVAQQPPVRLPSPSFLSFTAQPEDGGNELLCQYPKHAGGLGTYYLKRALEGRAAPPKSLTTTMSNMIWYMSAKLQAKGCKVSHNAVVPKAYSSLKPYFDLGFAYDSAYELQKNLATSHIFEVTTPVQIQLLLKVRLDQGAYVSDSFSFMDNPQKWLKHFRRDINKILYPKIDTALKTRVKSKSSQASPAPVAAPIKPRPEKSLRFRPQYVRPIPKVLVVEYADCPEMLLDDKRAKQVEKDLAKINEKCALIQQDEPHEFVFANGATIVGAITTTYSTGPAPAITSVSDKVSLLRKAVNHSRGTVVFSAIKLNGTDMNLSLAKRYLVNRIVPTTIPLSQYYHLSAGYIELHFNGRRKRVQQDFTINYLIAGCQRITVPGTTPVSLHKRPSSLWGQVEIPCTGNRRDLRKLDRLMRQQVFRSREGIQCIEFVSVKLDLIERAEHDAARRLQRRFRGHTVRRVLFEQHLMLDEEDDERRSFAFEEASAHFKLMGHFFGRGSRLWVDFESENRREIEMVELDERWWLIEKARELLQQAHERGHHRIRCEESAVAIPLLESILRYGTTVREVTAFQWIVSEHLFLHGVAWDRFYLEMDCLQEILRLRNTIRDSNTLENYQFGYVLDRPIPPSTWMDSGRSIIRSIIEEKIRRARKLAREKMRLVSSGGGTLRKDGEPLGGGDPDELHAQPGDESSPTH